VSKGHYEVELIFFYLLVAGVVCDIFNTGIVVVVVVVVVVCVGFVGQWFALGR
jgi:hypothetical protein